MANGNGDQDDPGFVRITNREIWQMLTDVRERVVDIVAEIESWQLERVDLKKRIRALELRFYGILAGVIGGLVTFAAILLRRP